MAGSGCRSDTDTDPNPNPNPEPLTPNPEPLTLSPTLIQTYIPAGQVSATLVGAGASSLVAVKVKGDANVPSGKTTWRTRGLPDVRPHGQTWPLYWPRVPLTLMFERFARTWRSAVSGWGGPAHT